MIHLGTWQDAAWPDQVDCIITDPPYSERTHSGQRGSFNNQPDRYGPQIAGAYASLSPADVQAWAKAWAPRVRYWIAVMCDHALIPHWSESIEKCGLYVFQPVPIIRLNPSPRFAGDGPASGAVYMIVARTKTGGKWQNGSWGSLPGHYTTIAAELGQDARIGGKPLPLMQQIVRDYSRPGMLVADPCAGHATTLVAALQAGRRVWGAECDPAAHAAAVARLERVTAQPQLITETIQPELL
jgi:site-specific DNA-methyltransferase (adenine-specific)